MIVFHHSRSKEHRCEVRSNSPHADDDLQKQLLSCILFIRAENTLAERVVGDGGGKSNTNEVTGWEERSWEMVKN